MVVIDNKDTTCRLTRFQERAHHQPGSKCAQWNLSQKRSDRLNFKTKFGHTYIMLTFEGINPAVPIIIMQLSPCKANYVLEVHRSSGILMRLWFVTQFWSKKISTVCSELPNETRLTYIYKKCRSRCCEFWMLMRICKFDRRIVSQQFPRLPFFDGKDQL